MTGPDQGVGDRLGTRGLIGMIHLHPLPGSPRWAGSMDEVLERASRDAEALERAGFDAVLVENFLDVPFFADSVPPETVAAVALAATAVRGSVAIPVGVNVLRNDVSAALGIAAATGASFVRANVHTGSMWTDQGVLHGRAAETVRKRDALAPTVRILADVHVKHATPPAGAELTDAAADAWRRGLADALVLSGSATGAETPLDDLERVRQALPEAALLVGSGTTPANVGDLLAVADGAIVGSAVMNGGRAGAGVDPSRAKELVDAAS